MRAATRGPTRVPAFGHANSDLRTRLGHMPMQTSPPSCRHLGPLNHTNRWPIEGFSSLVSSCVYTDYVYDGNKNIQ